MTLRNYYVGNSISAPGSRPHPHTPLDRLYGAGPLSHCGAQDGGKEVTLFSAPSRESHLLERRYLGKTPQLPKPLLPNCPRSSKKRGTRTTEQRGVDSLDRREVWRRKGSKREKLSSSQTRNFYHQHVWRWGRRAAGGLLAGVLGHALAPEIVGEDAPAQRGSGPPVGVVDHRPHVVVHELAPQGAAGAQAARPGPRSLSGSALLSCLCLRCLLPRLSVPTTPRPAVSAWERRWKLQGNGASKRPSENR